MVADILLDNDPPIPVAQVNVDENKIIRDKFGIDSYPMVVLFKNGTIVSQCVAREANKIVEWV